MINLYIYFFSFILFFFSYQANGFCSSGVQKCVDIRMGFWKDYPIVEFGDDRHITTKSWRYYKHRSIDGIPIKENYRFKGSNKAAESSSLLPCKRKN